MIETYGVLLEPLSLSTALLVREWRNAPRIRQFMDYQQEISEQQQIQWFREVEASRNYFFVIRRHQQPIGLIHLDRFSADRTTAFAGLFIGEEKFAGTGAAFAASLSLLDFAFEELKLHSVFAKVHRQNHIAIQYNAALGFREDGMENKDFLRLKVEQETYHIKRKQLAPLLSL